MGSIFKAAQDASKSPLFNFNTEGLLKKLKPYSPEAAAESYKGGDYLKLNAYLREDKGLPEDIMRLALGLDEKLKTMPIYKGAVYRTLGFSSDFHYRKFLDEWQQGKTVKTKAYTSASKGELYSDPTAMKYGVLMKLNSITGRDMTGIGLNESEVVFPRGVKFKVQKTKIQNTNAGSILFIAADEV